MDRRSGQLPTLLIGVLVLAAAAWPTAVGTPLAAAVSPGSTEVVSVGAGADQVGQAGSPAISADGSQIAFESRAALDPVVTGTGARPANIYVRDRRTPGRTVLISRGLPTTYLAAGRGYAAPRRIAALEVGGDDDSSHPAISASGRYVAFETVATNLRDSPAISGRRIVVCDRDPDADGTFDETRPDGLLDYRYLYVGRPEVATSDPGLAADGTVIAWRERPAGAAAASVVVARLVPDLAGRLHPPDPDGFRRPSVEGGPTTHGPPQVSADGRQVVFSAQACSPVLGCPADDPDVPAGTVQAFDLTADRTHRVDRLPGGGYSGRAGRPTVSGTGRLIAYEHLTGPGGPVSTVVVDRDPAAAGRLGPADGEPVSASVASRDLFGTAREGRAPALAAGGRYLAFESSADAMHGDTQQSGRTAIVLRDLVLDGSRERAGLPRLAGELGSPAGRGGCPGATASACPAAGPSESPRLSADGSVVTFTSASDDLVPTACCAGAVFARVFRPRVSGAATDFGAVPLGESVARTIVLGHSGFGPLVIRAVRLSGPKAGDFVLTPAENCAGARLDPAGGCQLSVAFRPSSAGSRQAVLQVEQTDGTTTEIPLVAEGTEPGPGPGPPEPPETPRAPSGGLVVTPDPVEFGGGRPALVSLGPQTVRVRNAATIAVTVTAVGILDGPRFVAGDFTVLATDCAAVPLPPGGSCSIEVGATPQGPGRRDGVLGITTTDPAFSRLISLASQAAQPVLQVNPAVVRMNRVTTVTGQNFPPGRSVTIVLATPGSRPAVTTVARRDGTVAVALLVFPQTSVGTWPVVATAGTTVRARSPLLVVPGSYQPPEFTSRR